ncbi:uncharacterized protein LOC103569456 [Microplitis demolitor]|uniref:uncharacterized protein LOC103569456 n=1 Tax=Microplitis demolitor TaxID=69319 RepID=UPI0004CD4C01|nr:uncharacterized protein LOC103569456 [Microplitis demolitor]
MNKYIAVLAMSIVIVNSQRPPYAGSSDRLPAVLPQYLQSSQNPNQGQGQSTSSSVDNRINIQQGNNPSTVKPQMLNLPVDAHGDIDLINRIQSWPKESQPFWYLNWKQIEQHRGGSSSNPASSTVRNN